MRERPAKGVLRERLDEFWHAGGVVEFVDIEDVEGVDLQAHKRAAVFGLETVANRWRARGASWRLTMDPERAAGHRISAEEFFGPAHGGGFALGFESAFKEPPHFRAGHPEDLFQAVCSGFGLRDLSFEIVAWSTDWSNYFDAGLEWWGAHLWTLRRGDGTILWIGASTTD